MVTHAAFDVFAVTTTSNRKLPTQIKQVSASFVYQQQLIAVYRWCAVFLLLEPPAVDNGPKDYARTTSLTK